MDNIKQIITKRKSIRTYTKDPITQELINDIKKYITTLSNPWGIKVNINILETKTNEKETDIQKKLGTYGFIKNATTFMATSIKNEENALEALGYELEELILYATSLELGTCWLGGSFNRGEFSKAVGLEKDEIMPVVTPIGYPSEKRSIMDRMIRNTAKGDQRKPWEELYFKGDFNTILTREESGKYKDALEMLRLAPSASNKQPWRILLDGNMYHFYEQKAPGYSSAFSYDIQRVDMGIAACHFHLVAMAEKLNGRFINSGSELAIEKSDDIIYKFTWLCE